MAGTSVSVNVDAGDSPAAIARLESALADPKALLRELGEYLRGSTQDRFRSMAGPDGTPWQPLSPRYLKRKRRNKDKILTLRGYLRSRIVYQLEGASAVAIGSALKYAAIHQFGGEISRRARQAEIFRKRNKAGEFARRFAKKTAKGAVATRVTIGAHSITMPARPYLGLSDTDRSELQARTQDFLRGLLA